VVVIDDKVAFCGGGDISTDRWDSDEHLDSDPRRALPSGLICKARHEVMSVMDGPAAILIFALVRSKQVSTCAGFLSADSLTRRSHSTILTLRRRHRSFVRLMARCAWTSLAASSGSRTILADSATSLVSRLRRDRGSRTRIGRIIRDIRSCSMFGRVRSPCGATARTLLSSVMTTNASESRVFSLKARFTLPRAESGWGKVSMSHCL
jgi:hypothetical protein